MEKTHALNILVECMSVVNFVSDVPYFYCVFGSTFLYLGHDSYVGILLL